MGHSLGGASLLIYAVMCRRARRPHRLYRLILLTPAGFLQSAPKVGHSQTPGASREVDLGLLGKASCILPYRLYRLILLTPAGFLQSAPEA